MTTTTLSPHERPSFTMQPLPYLVTRVHRETYDTVTLVLEPEDTMIGSWEPGQFTMLYAFGIGEIPVSISGDPNQPHRLVHTVRDVGAVSHALTEASAGNVIGVRGPFGRGWLEDVVPDQDVVIVAGGLGLAPVRPIIYGILSHRRRYGRVTVIVGARRPADLLYTREYEAWRESGITVTTTVDHADPAWVGHGWDGRTGLVTAPLAEAQIDGPWTSAFLCGPEVMMSATAKALSARGVPENRIVLSLERSMKCGIGTCGHCQLGPDLICRDGPCVTYGHAAPLLGIKEL
jgi:anaerobic sulfite reductase subunit B